MSADRFTGMYAAMVTPLKEGGAVVDAAAARELAVWLAEKGVDGLFVLGTTGEGLLLDADERTSIVAEAVRGLAGEARVIAHCGAVTTAESVRLAIAAESAGADAIAAMAPPFYPLDERGLVDHLAAVATATDLPFLVYQLPGATGHDITPAMVEEVGTRAENLAGIKDTTKSLDRLREYIALEGLSVLVGAEELLLEALEAGAAGTTSAVGGVYPDLPLAVIEAQRKGDPAAEALQTRLSELRLILRRGPYLAAYKAALRRRGVAVDEAMRPPLRALSPAERDDLFAALALFEAAGTEA
jgi:4-hydroxy-tetrahydrodipicolinate synthase